MMYVKFLVCVCLLILTEIGSANAASFQGCYRENKRQRYFGLSPGGYDPASLSIAKCLDLCRAYKYEYAGLTGNKDISLGFCFCGNDLPPVTAQENDAFCSSTCSDGSSGPCGGFDHVAIHKTGMPIKGVSLSADTPTGVTEIFKPVKFDFSVGEGPQSIIYQMEFGDGAEKSVGNATNMDTKTFSLPGEYRVTVHVSDVDIPSLSKKYSVKVLSQSPVSRVTLLCPEFAITYEEFKCNASVTGGSYMQVNLNWLDGSMDSFPISDSMLHAAGPVVPNAEIATLGNLGSAVSNIILMPSSEFQHDGELLGFEFYRDISAGTTGDMQIFVLSPNCVSLPYCHQTRSCSGTCGVYGEAACTTFCVSKGGCVENSCSATSRSLGAQPTFTVVDFFTVTGPATQDGYDKHILASADRIQVSAGDILGYKSLGDVTIATRSLDVSGELSDFDSGLALGGVGASGFPSSGVDISARHLLRGIAARPSWVLFYHEYTLPGQYELTVNVSTDLIDSSAADTFSLTVLEGINFVIIDAPEYGVTGEEVDFIIQPHTGTNVSYTWSWDLDGAENVTDIMQISHIFSTPGVYNVTVVASNPLTSNQNTTVITIEDRVVNVGVVSEVASVDLPHEMSFTADSGTDYTCQWTVGSVPPQTFTTNETSSPIAGGPVWHTYTSDGDYTVSVNCSNHISQDQYTFTQTVQYPIVGLVVDPPGAIVGTDFHITWRIDQGTDVTFTGTFQGVSLIPDVIDSLNGKSQRMTGMAAGLYSLTIYAENSVSNDTLQTNFTIEEKITGAAVDVDRLEISKNEAVTFTVSAESGTSIEILFDYDDGFNDSFSKGLLVPWLPGNQHTETHTFVSGGVFNVKITVKNNFDVLEFPKEIVVYNSVVGLTMESETVEFRDSPAAMAIWFLAPEAPTLATAVIDWGDGSSPQTLSNIQLHPTNYTHTYTKEGSYIVSGTVRNDVSSISLTTTVHLVVPVVNLRLTTDPPHGSVSEDVKVLISMDRGPGVTLELDWGEGAPVSWPRIGTTAWSEDTETHQYNAVGDYIISVTASNLLGNTTKTYTISVLNPVVNNFTLTSSLPQLYSPSGPNTMALTLTYPDALTLPDSASIIVDYGEGGPNNTLNLPFSDGVVPYTHTLNHDFSQAGAFTVTLTIYNLASTVQVQVQVGVYEAISGLEGSALYRQYEPYDNALYPGLGGDQNQFPFGKDVFFNITPNTGTVVKWLVSMVESDAEAIQMCDFTDKPLSVQFSQPGTWNVNVTAWNDFGEETKILTVTIFQSPSKLVLTDEGSSKPDQLKNVTLSFEDIGANACVLVDWGDESSTLYRNDSASCPVAVGETVEGTLSERMPVSHRYTTPGVYQVLVTATDPFTTLQEALQFWVSDTDCNAPSLRIEDHSPAGSVPREERMSSAFVVKAETELDCSVTLLNDKMWTVEKVNPDMTVSTSVDLSSLYSRTNAELAIPARFLNYGLYKFTYNVTMERDSFPNNEEFSSEIETYILIVSSDLIAGLMHSGISLIQRGQQEQVTLDAGSNSYDPDLSPQEPQLFDTFEWSCRDIEENSNGAGCFGPGPGAIGTSDSTLTFDTGNMRENHTYEFTTVVIKGVRRATTKLLVAIIPGSPPVIEIECSNAGFCSPVSDGLLVNLGSRVKLRAVCSECDLDSLTLRWNLFRKGLEKSWIQVDDLDQYVQGLSSKEIAIPIKLFEEGFRLYEDMDTYRVTLSARYGSSIGEVYTTINLNQGPIPGTCSVFPKQGTVYTETFNISCTNWYDPDGIVSYQFYAKYPDLMIEKHLSFTDAPELITQLAEGSYKHDYNMSLWVRVADRLGSTTNVEIGTVRVSPKDEVSIRAELDEIRASQPNNIIDETIAKGNLLDTNLEFQRIAAALNLEHNYDASSYNELSDTPKSTATQYDDYNDNPVTAQTVYQRDNLTAEEQEELEQKYQEARDSRAQIRTQMVESLEGLTIEGVGNILFCSTTLEIITRAPEELSRASQGSVVNMLQEMTSRLKALEEDTSIEELRQATAMMAEVVGNTLEGANIAIDDSVNSDLVDSQDSEYYYYDTYFNSNREGFFDRDIEDAETGLTHETNVIVQTNDMLVTVPDGLQVVIDTSRMLSEAMVSGENATTITTPRLSLTVAKDAAENILNREHDEGSGSFFLPNWCDMLPTRENCSNSEEVSFVSIATPSNIFGHLGNRESVLQYSSTLTLELYDENGERVVVQQSEEPIELSIPRDTKLTVADAEKIDEQSSKPSKNLFYHKFNISAKGSSLHIEVRPTDTSVQFLVLVRFGDFPQLNATLKEWDFLALSPLNMSEMNNNASGVDPYTVFLDNHNVADYTGPVYVGLKQLPEGEHDLYSDTNTPQDAPNTVFTTTYSIQTWTSGCYFEKNGLWHTEGCTVMPTTSYYTTDCQCNHLTSFAAGFVVEPNTIDFDFVFSNLDFFKNPTLYVTEILVAVLYLGFAIWARREDKKDLEKLGVTPLVDNNPKDRYLYEVQVCTGSRKNAATDSKVNMIFSGEYDETDVRTFEDPKRKIFRRGTTNNFLMAASGPLGPIQYVRIWHDNSGKGKFQGWYCRHLIVHDLQTKEKFFFIVNKWFAVEEDDGQIDRLFPVAGPENLVEFDVLFSQKTRRNLSDEHLWFSVVARPPRSRFTRLQRVSCCLCLLFTSMLASAMFYQQTGSGAGQNTLVIGPFALTPEQVYVGVISNLMVFPVNFLIVTLFRKSRPRKKRKSRIEEALQQYKNNVRISSAASDSDRRQLVQENTLDPQFSSIDSRSSTPKLSPAQPLQPAHQPNMTTLNMDRFSKSHGKEEPPVKSKKKKPLSFPWWCQIVAWLLLWLVTLTCVAFVTFYGISFEDVKCKKWISSMVISFLTSIFLTQPIKVFLVALTLALVFKKADMDDEGFEDEEDVKLQQDETWLHHYPATHDLLTTQSTRKLAYKPPDPSILEKAREQRLKELKMYDILREILFYSFYLWILLVVSYGFRDPNAFHMKQSLDSVFIDRGLGKVHVVSTPDNDFRKVVTRKNFFNWLKDVHVPSLRAKEWYNDAQPFYQRGMATDRVSRIMGFSTLRQLRVHRDLCKTLKDLRETVPTCNKPYSMLDEDTGDYGIKWGPMQGNSTWNNSKSEFTYRTGSEIDTYPYWGKHGFYSGGGFVVEMGGSLPKVVKRVEQLERDEWIDKYTRAVFVEFTVYNAQVNLFGVVTLLAEFLNSGGILTSHRIEPMNLLGYSSSVYAFQIACEITYLLFILFFIIKEVRNMYKQKKNYVKQFWNWVEICIIVLSISCVVIYFYRWYHANQLTEYFKETHGNAYMKFQYTAYWNEVLLYFMGMLCFLASIKFIRLLRFNRRMGMLASTLSYGAKPLFLFMIMFIIMFMAYAQFFYLIYYIRIDNFRTLIHTMQTLLQMLVGKFNFNAMQSADPVMGPLIFSFYVVTVYYILINMFLTILNESFAAVRADIAKQTNDHEMVEFIMARFRQWTGLNALFGAGKKEEEEANKEPTVQEQMEAFPEKVDRLLDVLCHAYLNSDHFDAMFDSSRPEGKLAMKSLMKSQQAGGKVPPSYSSLQAQAPAYSLPQPGGMGGARPKTKY